MWEEVSFFRGKLKDAKRPSPGRGLFAGHLGVSISLSFLVTSILATQSFINAILVESQQKCQLSGSDHLFA